MEVTEIGKLIKHKINEDIQNYNNEQVKKIIENT